MQQHVSHPPEHSETHCTAQGLLQPEVLQANRAPAPRTSVIPLYRVPLELLLIELRLMASEIPLRSHCTRVLQPGGWDPKWAKAIFPRLCQRNPLQDCLIRTGENPAQAFSHCLAQQLLRSALLRLLPHKVKTHSVGGNGASWEGG